MSFSFGQSSNAFDQSNPPGTNNLFSSSDNSLPSGGFPSFSQNTPFQFNDTFSDPISSVSQQTQSALVNGVFDPTANTTTSGGAGTIPQFGVHSGNFGFTPSIWANSATSPSTSVFVPSSSTTITTGQLSEPSRTTLFRPFGSPTFTPSTTFPFGHSSSPAFTPGKLSQPSTTFTFGSSSSPVLTTSQLSQPSTTFTFGLSSSPALTTSQLPQPSTTFMSGPSRSPSLTTNQLSQPATTFSFGPLSSSALISGQLPQHSATFTFGPSSSPARTTSQLSQPATTFSFGTSSGQLSQPSTTFPFGPSSSLTFTTNQSLFQTMTVPSGPTMRSMNGTQVTAYAKTTNTDNSSSHAEWLTSISAMPTYREKSHEELKWEDYQINDKDKGLNSPMQNISLNNPFSTIPSNIFTLHSTIPGSQNSSLCPPSSLFPINSTVSQPLLSPAFGPFSNNSVFLNKQTCMPSITPPPFPNSNICVVPSTEVVRNSVPGSQSFCPTCSQVIPGQPAPSGFCFVPPTQNGETSEAIPKTNSAPNRFETLARVTKQIRMYLLKCRFAASVTEEKQPSPVMSPSVSR